MSTVRLNSYYRLGANSNVVDISLASIEAQSRHCNSENTTFDSHFVSELVRYSADQLRIQAEQKEENYLVHSTQPN